MIDVCRVTVVIQVQTVLREIVVTKEIEALVASMDRTDNQEHS